MVYDGETVVFPVSSCAGWLRACVVFVYLDNRYLPEKWLSFSEVFETLCTYGSRGHDRDR